MLGVAFSDKGFYQVHFLGKRIKFYASYWALGFLCSSVNMCCFCVMLSLVHVFRHVNPESLILALTRLRDSLVERRVTSFSLPVYDPNRGKLVIKFA